MPPPRPTLMVRPLPQQCQGCTTKYPEYFPVNIVVQKPFQSRHSVPSSVVVRNVTYHEAVDYPVATGAHIHRRYRLSHRKIKLDAIGGQHIIPKHAAVPPDDNARKTRRPPPSSTHGNVSYIKTRMEHSTITTPRRLNLKYPPSLLYKTL